MHLALAAASASPDFAAEPFSAQDQADWCEDAHALSSETFRLLREKSCALRGEHAELAIRVLQLESVRIDHLRHTAAEPVRVFKIRCHGDYHLGQVLVAGDDFIIVDFEGEPSRPLAQRRRKQLRCATWRA